MTHLLAVFAFGPAILPSEGRAEHDSEMSRVDARLAGRRYAAPSTHGEQETGHDGADWVTASVGAPWNQGEPVSERVGADCESAIVDAP